MSRVSIVSDHKYSKAQTFEISGVSKLKYSKSQSFQAYLGRLFAAGEERSSSGERDLKIIPAEQTAIERRSYTGIPFVRGIHPE